MEALSHQPILMTVLVVVDLGAAKPSQSSHPVTLPGDKYPWTESSKLDKQLEQTSPSTWIESEGEDDEKWVWGVVKEEESGSRFEELQEGSGDGKTVFEIILEDIFETS